MPARVLLTLRRAARLAASLALLVGCGPPQIVFNGTVTGTVKGKPFNPWVVLSSRENGTITITTTSSACSDYAAALEQGSSLALEMFAMDCSGNGSSATCQSAVAPGTYTVSNNLTTAHLASGFLSATDASCHDPTRAMANAGTITLTRASPRHGDPGYAGTFDLRFDNGDHLTGSFDATECSAFAQSHATTCY